AGCGRVRRTRSRTTYVPASRSPRRLAREFVAATRTARPPRVIQISTKPRSPRMRACRNPIGPVSSRTVRRPRASLPSVRPWSRVSCAIGSPTRAATRSRIATAWSRAKSVPTSSHGATQRTRSRNATTTSRSMSPAAMRWGRLAAGRSISTASDVTKPSVSKMPRVATDLRVVVAPASLGRRPHGLCRGPFRPVSSARILTSTGLRRVMPVDLDALVSRRQAAWSRLAELARRRPRTGAEADELLDGYQRVATDLSVVRSTTPDPSLVTHLSVLLARARLRSAGTRTTTWATVGRFFVEDFPAALYRLRWWWGLTAILNVVVGLVLGAWLVRNPVIENTLMSPAEVAQLVNVQFEAYYSENEASSFATLVWVNNA